MELRASPTLSKARKYTSSYLTLRHRRSTNTLSRQAPLPSMLIAMPWSTSTPVKAAPMNCEPWSVLKISGLPDQGVLQRLDAECCFHRDRYAPRQHAATEPVEHD